MKARCNVCKRYITPRENCMACDGTGYIEVHGDVLEAIVLYLRVEYKAAIKDNNYARTDISLIHKLDKQFGLNIVEEK